MKNKLPQRILGLDPGYGRLGFGVLSSNARRQLSYVTCGVITTQAGTPTADRLLEIARDIEALIDRHDPDLIAIEELFFVKNITTALKVAEVRGVILYLASKRGLPIIEIKPTEIKMAVSGDGHADKRQMQKMITMLLKLDAVPQPDDAADALAVAWAGEGKYRL
ncbi:MAG TPA: crossover junction endodeoxyribonuclease RuvC [bacterium]|nr:crossover junction endodeoxyribonuclease RuvC [bacterium]